MSAQAILQTEQEQSDLLLGMVSVSLLSDLLAYAIQHNLPTWIIKWLLKRGADPNAFTLVVEREQYLCLVEYQLSLLHIAARRGRYKVVKLLLEYGADPLAIDNEFARRTPLHYAVCEGNAKTLCLLLDYAPITTVDGKGWTIIEHIKAQQDSELFETVLQHQLSKPFEMETIEEDIESTEDTVEVEAQIGEEISATETRREESMENSKDLAVAKKYSQRYDTKRFTGTSFRHDVRYNRGGKGPRELVAQLYVVIAEEGAVFAKISNDPDKTPLFAWDDMQVVRLASKQAKTTSFVIKNEKFIFHLTVAFEDEMIMEGCVRRVKNYYVEQVTKLSSLLSEDIFPLTVHIEDLKFGAKKLHIAIPQYNSSSVTVEMVNNNTVTAVYGEHVRGWKVNMDSAEPRINSIRIDVDDCVLLILIEHYEETEEVHAKLMSLDTFYNT